MNIQLASSIAGLFLLGVGTAAQPAATPAGWTRIDTAHDTRYAPNDQAGVEFRLYPPTSSEQPLQSWFARRLQQHAAELGRVQFQSPTTAPTGAMLAMGDRLGASPAQWVFAMGCQTGGAGRRFAYLLVPTDEAIVARYVHVASRLMATACLERQAQPVTAMQSTRPAAATVPAVVASPPTATTKTSPAQPLESSQIQGVLHSWEQRFEINMLQFREQTYLLLKDGSARRDVPAAAPGDFDLAADRRSEPNQPNQPNQWGQWQRVGQRVLLNFGQGYEEPPNQARRWPAKTGERLHGVFEISTGSATLLGPGGVFAWSDKGLQLTRDGQFKRWRSGGVAGSAGMGDQAVSTVGVHSDKGSALSTGGSNFAAGGSRQTGVSDDDLEGSYELDGWSITLRYRSGKVQRSFFYVNETRQQIWFEGSELVLLREK